MSRCTVRLLTISDAVEHWMDTHQPDVIAIERVFAQQNVSTVMGTAQAGGVIALAAARRGIDVHFHTPSEVKAAVTGNGRADKAQVTAMVTRILALQTKPTPADAADALALAICHCWRAPMIARMAAAEALAAEQQKKYQATTQGGTMIASIRGEVLDVALDHVVIEACGVGYRVNATPSTLATLAPRRRGPTGHRDDRARGLDDAVRLRRLRFARPVQTLLSVSGVGPKIALATLAVHDAPALRQALADGDVTALTRVPGIGKRSAERMVLELRDKVGPVDAAVGLPRPSTAMRCAARWWKPLSDLALRPSRPRRPPTRCSPTTRMPPRRARCAPRCPCWVRRNEPIRRRHGRGSPTIAMSLRR